MKVLVVAFIAHFIADFLMQSRKMGKEKSEKFTVLMHHIGIQFAVMTIALSCVLPHYFFAIIIASMNALIHGVIDWNIWKGYKLTVGQWLKNHPDHEDTKKYLETGVWRYWDDHVFYTTIGLDQLLHGLTLIILLGKFL